MEAVKAIKEKRKARKETRKWKQLSKEKVKAE
jgi:hypothetical protein